MKTTPRYKKHDTQVPVFLVFNSKDTEQEVRKHQGYLCMSMREDIGETRVYSLQLADELGHTSGR